MNYTAAMVRNDPYAQLVCKINYYRKYLIAYFIAFRLLVELDYVFGHSTGILVSGTTWFIIYCILKKNRPQVYPKIILPGLISGIMAGLAIGTKKID